MTDEQEITAPFETETLAAGWAARSATAAVPKCHAFLALGAKTDLGRIRENNEDKFDFIEPDDPSVLATKGRVYAVADGMGGHSAGQIAAELALNVFIRAYYANTSPDLEANLTRAVQEANAYILDVARAIPGRSGMGATLTAAVVRDDDLMIAQVGDSRCYLLRNGRLEQLTEDHSWVAEQVRSGAMTEAEAEQSPFRNVITRSMGGAPEVTPDLTAVKLLPGDRFLLCSDGLSGMVPPTELAALLAEGSPSVAAWNLVERANQYGGKDNITALVLHVLDIQPWPETEETPATAEIPETAEAEPAANGRAAHAGPAPAPPAAGSAAPAEGPPAHRPSRAGLMDRLFRRA